MTLVSNASMDTHPNNSMANFITELFTPIRFEQPFEVALVEIVLPSVEKDLAPVGSVEFVKDIGISVMMHVGRSDFQGLDYAGVLKKLNVILLFNGRRLSLPSAASLAIRTINEKKYVSIENMARDFSLCFYGDLADYLGFPKSVDGFRVKLKADSLSAEVED